LLTYFLTPIHVLHQTTRTTVLARHGWAQPDRLKLAAHWQAGF